MTSPTTSVTSTRGLPLAIAILRILLGFEFLWAFLDKTFGLGFSTSAAKAWVNGGSPTTGYLSAPRTFSGFYSSLANNGLVDVIFMLGLLGVGAALILGIGVRIGAIAGSVMLVFMYFASFPLTTNPIIDEHILELGIMAIIFLSVPNQVLSLAPMWRKLTAAQTWLW